MTALGLNIPNFGPGTDPAVLRGWTGFAADHGYTLAMVSDHVAPTPDVAELYPAPFYDPFATLAWMAGHADGLELGTTVTILPYRHPLLTASMAAAINDFTGGRFVLGVGAGWAEQEFAALGVPFAERGRITDEYLGAIIEAWRSPLASLDGRYASYADVATGPRVAPRVWVGGAAAPAIRRAARFGDAWHPNNAPIDWLRDTGLPALRALSDRTAFCPRMRARVTGRDLPSDGRRAGEGSLRQVVGDVRELMALGAAYVVLDTNPDHPRDRRPAADDWRDLAAIAEALRG